MNDPKLGGISEDPNIFETILVEPIMWQLKTHLMYSFSEKDRFKHFYAKIYQIFNKYKSTFYNKK